MPGGLGCHLHAALTLLATDTIAGLLRVYEQAAACRLSSSLSLVDPALLATLPQLAEVGVLDTGSAADTAFNTTLHTLRPQVAITPCTVV
jgi:hypothetical protein